MEIINTVNKIEKWKATGEPYIFQSRSSEVSYKEKRVKLAAKYHKMRKNA